MIKKIIVLLSLLILSTTILTANGQIPEDLYQNGESLTQQGILAKITTDRGVLVFELDYSNAPLTTMNFINISEEGFYNGMTFYRNIENYALFAGDPTGKGSSDKGYNFPQETGNLIPFDKPGILSMDAVSGMTSSSRFFITKTADPVLNKKYTAFGRLLEGNAVLFKLKRGDSITSVEIIKNGAEAQAFKSDKALFTELSDKALNRQLETFKAENPEVFTAITALGEGVQKSLTGIYYKISKEGTGNSPAKGDTVSVHYTAMMIDGTVFDSSISRGKPFEFALGTQAVIAGWDESIMDMKVGEQRSIIIPPNLAYGDVQAGPIPPGSWLIFQVELLDIK